MLTRHDEFVMAGNRSGSWQKLKAGVKKDGTIVALQAHAVSSRRDRPGSQAGQPYIYQGRHAIARSTRCTRTRTASIAMRAPGHPQASFAMESLMDELAYKIGMDPVEFRKKNLRDEVYHRQLDRGAKEIGWSTTESGRRRQSRSAETRHGLRGRHVGRRRQQPVQSRRHDLARRLGAGRSGHAGPRHRNTHVHARDRRRRIWARDQRCQGTDRQLETRLRQSVGRLDDGRRRSSPSVKDAAIKARTDDGRTRRAVARQSEAGGSRFRRRQGLRRKASRSRGSRRARRFRPRASRRTASGAQTCRRAAFTVFALPRSKSTSRPVTSSRSRWSTFRTAACR